MDSQMPTGSCRILLRRRYKMKAPFGPVAVEKPCVFRFPSPFLLPMRV